MVEFFQIGRTVSVGTLLHSIVGGCWSSACTTFASRLRFDNRTSEPHIERVDQHSGACRGRREIGQGQGHAQIHKVILMPFKGQLVLQTINV